MGSPGRGTRVAGVMVALATVCAFAQEGNPRIGKWKLKQDAPPPALNIMTYDALPGGGMRVTVDTTGRDGRKSHWTYDTMFDGKDMPVTGHPSADTTSVRRIDKFTTEIVNKKSGRVLQTITNVITADGNTINNTYKNYDEKGELTGTTTAVYERIR